jgi:PAS domain S-box-containing protein
MAPGTALLFALSGIGLWCAASHYPDKASGAPTRGFNGQAIAQCFAGVVIVIASLRLISYATHVDLGLDLLWFVRFVPPGTIGRMSQATALDFVFLGVGLYIASIRRWPRIVQFFALAGGLLAWLGFSRYLFGGQPLVPFSQMAANTSITFMIFSVGLLCLDEETGITALLVTESTGGVIARRLVPAVLIIPFVLGWSVLQGEHAGWFQGEAGIALFALANVLIFGGLICSCAFYLHNSDLDRRCAWDSLRFSEERWVATLRSIGDAVISTDASGTVDFMNEVAEKLTGWSLSEVQGKDLSEVFNIVQEVTRRKSEHPVAKVLRLGMVVGLANHTVLIHRDGTEIPIDDSAAPIKGRTGKVEGVVLVFRDASERKKVEKVLRTNERLATTGRLAATIAHEIHNPLDAVGNLLFLIGEEAPKDTTQEYVTVARQELGRVTQITRQMLTFQREAAKPIPVNIGEILNSVTDLYSRKLASSNIELKKQLHTDKSILALPGELRQVFANLVGNAIEAMGSRKGAITLRVNERQNWRTGKQGLRVIVADNGPGIPAELRDKIFEPFFTTKGESGTGLGLWITLDIIHKCQGTIRLRSSTREGHSGTTFYIFFPFDLQLA